MNHHKVAEYLSPKVPTLCENHPSRKRHVSFVMNRMKILSCGLNKMAKTHPSSPAPFKTICAEFDAIRKLPMTIREIRRARLVMVNFRLLKDGSFGMSAPCAFCRKLLTMLNFRSVIYYDGNTFRELLL